MHSKDNCIVCNTADCDLQRDAMFMGGVVTVDCLQCGQVHDKRLHPSCEVAIFTEASFRARSGG